MLEENVLQLQVAVHDVVGVAVGDGGEDRVDVLACHFLAIVLTHLPVQSVQQVSAFAELHDHIDELVVLEDFMHAEDVWMVQMRHASKFSFQALQLIIREVVLAEGFQSVVNPGGFMHTDGNLPRKTSPKNRLVVNLIIVADILVEIFLDHILSQPSGDFFLQIIIEKETVGEGGGISDLISTTAANLEFVAHSNKTISHAGV